MHQLPQADKTAFLLTSHLSSSVHRQLCPKQTHSSTTNKIMPGKLAEWPNWPEFSLETAETGDDLVGYKKTIVEKYGQEALTQSWLKTCKALEGITDEIATAGSNYIPEINIRNFSTFPAKSDNSSKTWAASKSRAFSQRSKQTNGSTISRVTLRRTRTRSLAGLRRHLSF